MVNKSFCFCLLGQEQLKIFAVWIGVTGEKEAENFLKGIMKQGAGGKE